MSKIQIKHTIYSQTEYMVKGALLRMDFQHLRYFVEVAEQLSFSRSAETLHISQPSLSKAVKNLEEELGVVLFNRSTRHLRLTDDGDIFLQYARATLAMSRDLQASLSEGKQLKRGKISFGLPPVIGSSFFPNIIAAFRRTYPQVQLQLVEEGGKVVEQYVREAKLDLGAVVLPVDETLYETLPFAESPLSLIVPAAHPLAGQPIVRLAQLKNEPFILFKEGFSLYDRVREACIREGFEPEISFESSQWDFIGEMVAAGLGIAFLPSTVAVKLDRSTVGVIAETEPPIPWNLAVIWSRQIYLSHASRGWLRFIREWRKQQPGTPAGATTPGER